MYSKTGGLGITLISKSDVRISESKDLQVSESHRSCAN